MKNWITEEAARSTQQLCQHWAFSPAFCWGSFLSLGYSAMGCACKEKDPWAGGNPSNSWVCSLLAGMIKLQITKPRFWGLLPKWLKFPICSLFSESHPVSILPQYCTVIVTVVFSLWTASPSYPVFFFYYYYFSLPGVGIEILGRVSIFIFLWARRAFSFSFPEFCLPRHQSPSQSQMFQQMRAFVRWLFVNLIHS